MLFYFKITPLKFYIRFNQTYIQFIEKNLLLRFKNFFYLELAKKNKKLIEFKYNILLMN